MGLTCAPDMDARRRRLDELFEDQPHLSATMMASRLHELERPPLRFLSGEQSVDLASPANRPQEPVPSMGVAKLGFVVNIRQEPEGLRAEFAGQDAADVMTLSEAARYLKVSECTVRRWVRENRLPCARVGRSRRFRRTALLRWLRFQEGVR